MVAIYKPAGVIIEANAWTDDPFDLPTPSGNRYILNVYDGTGTFGVLMKRSTDNKIYSTITLSATNAIGICGVAK